MAFKDLIGAVNISGVNAAQPAQLRIGNFRSAGQMTACEGWPSRLF